MSLSIVGSENAKAYRAKIRALRLVEDEIEKELAARQKELERIQASKIKLRSRATYRPTDEALAYYEANWAAIARQPKPIHGGRIGLKQAAAEAAGWWTEAQNRRAS